MNYGLNLGGEEFAATQTRTDVHGESFVDKGCIFFGDQYAITVFSQVFFKTVFMTMLTYFLFFLLMWIRTKLHFSVLHLCSLYHYTN